MVSIDKDIWTVRKQWLEASRKKYKIVRYMGYKNGRKKMNHAWINMRKIR